MKNMTNKEIQLSNNNIDLQISQFIKKRLTCLVAYMWSEIHNCYCLVNMRFVKNPLNTIMQLPNMTLSTCFPIYPSGLINLIVCLVHETHLRFSYGVQAKLKNTINLERERLSKRNPKGKIK